MSTTARLAGALIVASCVVFVSECASPESFRAGPNGLGTSGQGGVNLTGASGANALDAGSTAGAGGTTGAAGALGSAGVTGAAGALGSAGVTGAAGGSGSGTAGVSGSAGVNGTAGASGTAGAKGTAGASGAAGAGDAGVDAAPSCSNCALKVQYECRQNGQGITPLEFSIKVVNTGPTAIPLSDVSVRYWYTIDGTGGQAGNCASTNHLCTITFQSNTPAKTKADEYGVISFSGGTLAPGADTGEVQIEIFATGPYTQTNDYSFNDTGANFIYEMNLTGYVAGKLVWGTAP